MGHKFPPERWEMLVAEERRELLPPEAILDRIGVRQEMDVADLGAGPGYFTAPLADRVGPAGRVFAVELQPAMIEILARRGLPPQVEAVLGGEATIPLGAASVDLAFLAFVLHELDDPPAFLSEVRRILRPGGRLAVLEWVPREVVVGPPLHERIPEDAAARILEVAGFAVAERSVVNPSVYLLVARPEPHADG